MAMHQQEDGEESFSVLDGDLRGMHEQALVVPAQVRKRPINGDSLIVNGEMYHVCR